MKFALWSDWMMFLEVTQVGIKYATRADNDFLKWKCADQAKLSSSP